MEAELATLPKKPSWSCEWEAGYEAEFRNDNVRNGTVTCAALSRDGHHVALGFGSGIIEVADIDNQHTICRFQSDPSYPPVWIEFIHGGDVHIATEDTQGNTTIFSHETPPVKLRIPPSSHYPPLTTVSDNGCFVVRVPRNLEDVWYENTTLLCILGNPSIQLLAPPSTAQSSKHSSLPLRQSLGFSPGGRYVCAYDAHDAFVWSTYSGELVARFCAQGFDKWIINTGVAPLAHILSPPP
ncbi:uncharacterized protein EI90DRAFT_332261 [Cantharellus anzutake]|uniref:uncharacterized protein n=1 Tax=Cantharellus anzutake TaxID=1750568 RepID=UPI001908D8CD|nr:uncharacterized protein EI90DRAFT_332261 [Cantharellus anzutake]KAF8335463.1 hypothetical protein EI90DRAFT_332261 [Cantharellus anzutake]